MSTIYRLISKGLYTFLILLMVLRNRKKLWKGRGYVLQSSLSALRIAMDSTVNIEQDIDYSSPDSVTVIQSVSKYFFIGDIVNCMQMLHFIGIICKNFLFKVNSMYVKMCLSVKD